MMIITVLIGLLPLALSATNVITVSEDATREANNKTKRTVLNQEPNYGENKAIILYDQLGSPAALATFQSPPTIRSILEPYAPPKRVAAQQYIYEFQQTPTNAVSNVHVNQVYQPLHLRDLSKNPQNSANPVNPINQVNPVNPINPLNPLNALNQLNQPTSPPNPLNLLNHQSNPLNQGNQNNAAESVVNPVQHNTFIRHVPHPAGLQAQPQHIQSQLHIPGKYLYINGKIIYQPSGLQQLAYPSPQPTNVNPLLQTHPQIFYPNPHHQQTLHNQAPIRPVHFHYGQQHNSGLNGLNRGILQNKYPLDSPNQKLAPPPPPLPPITKNFNPPLQMQRITKPIINNNQNDEVEQKEDEEEESPAKEDVKEDEEEDVEDDANQQYENLEDEEEEDRNSYERYTEEEDDDDDEDHAHYREEEEEEDEDSERGSSHNIPTKTKKGRSKNSKPFGFTNNYKFSESYKSRSKYTKPTKKDRKSTKKHSNNNKKRKDNKHDKIVAKHSENVPVVLNKKIFTKKWYVTKSDTSL